MSSIKRTGGGEGVATLCSITILDSRLLDSSTRLDRPDSLSIDAGEQAQLSPTLSRR